MVPIDSSSKNVKSILLKVYKLKERHLKAIFNLTSLVFKETKRVLVKLAGAQGLPLQVI